jgi:ABC-type glycerol-3-phosphate transport system permease component
VGSTVLAGLLGLFALVPILFVLVQSIDGSPPGSDAARLWPRQPTLHNFVAVFGNRDFYHSTSTTRPALALNFFNSLVVSVTVTVIVLVTGSLAGYALARWRGWTPNITTSLLIVVQFVPQVILVFPLYGILARAHLLNSRTGLILATAAVSLPVAVLFFRVFFQGMSKDLEEAAKLDGAGSLRIFARIVAPNARPAFGAMGAFTLIGTWNEFVLALTLIQDPSRRTFPPALQQFTQLAFNYADAKNTPGVQAVYLLIPIATSVLLLSFTVRHFTAAVQGGGVKG